jgi:hypothetical protein
MGDAIYGDTDIKKLSVDELKEELDIIVFDLSQVIREMNSRGVDVKLDLAVEGSKTFFLSFRKESEFELTAIGRVTL